MQIALRKQCAQRMRDGKTRTDEAHKGRSARQYINEEELPMCSVQSQYYSRDTISQLIYVPIDRSSNHWAS